MIFEFGMRSSECGIQDGRGTRVAISELPCFSFRNPQSAIRNRHAVTLIELLITITIVATLSATFLGVSRSAMESSRAARTKTLINKIDTLLMEKWSSYATRRVDIDTSILSDDGSGIDFATRRERGQMIARARLDAMRAMMRQEMPDRWSDILNASVTNRLPGANTDSAPTRIARDFGSGNLYNMLLPYPAVTSTFLRRYNSLPFASLPGDADDKVALIEENQGAECLYLIIMLSTADGEARTLFREQDIGDTDGDGALEFLDGWGRPIHFLRWPAGFAEAGLSNLVGVDADTDHDPFDHFRIDNPPTTVPLGDNRGYRHVPLIFSEGPDGIADIVTSVDAFMTQPSVALAMAAAIDPYENYGTDSVPIKMGTPLSPFVFPNGIGSVDDDDGENWLDNIHNHLQDNR